jgi:hypothetical protein
LKIGHQKYISELSNILPISTQLLVPDIVFPVYKIDREKNVSTELLKIPKKYSEAVVFDNFLKDYIFSDFSLAPTKQCFSYIMARTG